MSDFVNVICVKTGFMENNTYIVKNTESGEGFIVDASFSPETIIKAVRDSGVELKAVFLTHCHYDHIYSVNDIKDAFKESGVKVYAGEDEGELLSSSEMNLFGKHRVKDKGIEADVLLKDGEEIFVAGIRIRTVFTPGHTVGGVCYYIEDEKLLFSGDTLFAGSHGRTDLPTGDIKALYDSITNKLFTLPVDTVVLPGHRGASTIGVEKETNPILMNYYKQ